MLPRMFGLVRNWRLCLVSREVGEVRHGLVLQFLSELRIRMCGGPCALSGQSRRPLHMRDF